MEIITKRQAETHPGNYGTLVRQVPKEAWDALPDDAELLIADETYTTMHVIDLGLHVKVRR
ncbi:hypothetical protein I6F11_23405 [Ensifer sp. NBAIM29]|nr:hypothetical protein [Ensifer sp. NBAIM29]